LDDLLNSFFVADTIAPVIQRLLLGMDIHIQGSALLTLLGLLRLPTSSVNAVRTLNNLWDSLDIPLPEEFLQELEVLISRRRVEFITALSEVMEQVQRQDVVNTARGASLSATSSLTTAASSANSGGSGLLQGSIAMFTTTGSGAIPTGPFTRSIFDEVEDGPSSM
jgi:hypothetical protein